jgi:probable rRNA maturation factor
MRGSDSRLRGNDSAVEVVDEQKFAAVSKPRIARLIQSVLSGERAGSKRVTVLFTDDRRIKKYHKDYFGDATATDVISFNAGEPQTAAEAGYLGDVVVSVQMAVRRAAEFGVTPNNELERYAVHGVLHLLGYKDKKAADHKKMYSKQEQYLKKFAR